LKDRLSDKKAQQTVHETQMKLPRTTYPFLWLQKKFPPV
jgi:hypothetical protein